ncbi:MAG: FAD-dependent oxidoreductase [Acidobacteria bacterium]|nr:FAD-dependent oxidoreductase [Acidobacteriota bacterium]
MGRTVVIGGGIIGLLAALELRRRGEEVVLIDRGEPGAACSRGNLGWIVPSMSEPLPSPGLLSSMIRSTLHGEGLLSIHPPAIPSLLGWLWRFWRHCNRDDYERGLIALAALNRETFSLFNALAEDGVGFEMHRSRILLVAFDPKELDEIERNSPLLARCGVTMPERLSAADTRAFEPALAPGIAGGLLYPDERHVRPDTLCAGVLEKIAASGVEVRAGCEARSIRRSGSVVAAVVTDGGTIEADRFLIAAGAWSGRLAGAFGLDLPVQAGKGYSLTLGTTGDTIRTPLYLQEGHVGLSPYDGGLRLGGVIELSGINTRIVPRRLDSIWRVARRYLPGLNIGEGGIEWTGMRPVSPDGVPVIGRAPLLENLFIATGHAMLGVTLAPATARVITDQMLDGKSAIDMAPFDPARFQPRRLWSSAGWRQRGGR